MGSFGEVAQQMIVNTGSSWGRCRTVLQWRLASEAKHLSWMRVPQRFLVVSQHWVWGHKGLAVDAGEEDLSSNASRGELESVGRSLSVGTKRAVHRSGK